MRNKDLLEKVVEAQRDFVYEKTADTERLSAWWCRKPGTRIYSFEIIFGLFGTYVNGDIDHLVFRVGGLKFLAGDDVDYYIHSKLAHGCKDVELDPERLDEWIKNIAIYALGDNCPEDPDNMALCEIIKTCRNHPGTHPYADLYEDTRDCDLHEAERAIEQYWSDIECDEYPSITRPAWSTMFSLYMACYAARRIQEQEQE